MLTLPRFRWSRPASLDDALAVLAEHGARALPIAGGTDAVPNLKHRLHEPEVVVHLGALEELRYVRDAADGLHVGPLVTLDELHEHPAVRRDFPALSRAAGLIAGPQLRHMGTVGGNLCLDTRCTYYNQTYMWREALGFCLKKDGVHCHVVPQGKRCVAAHSSDLAGVLIALGAEIEIASTAGRRSTSAEAFFVADGIHNNVLAANELVTRVFLPASVRGFKSGYQKLRLRRSIDFPMLSVAFAARGNGVIEEARLVVSALAAKPKVIGGVDRIMVGRAVDDEVVELLAKAAYTQCRPQTNVPYDTWWRHEMVPVFVRRAVHDAMAAGEKR